MAEILLSLTIIGVVAAITLPSLTGNINERTWNTQRKALYARMSQAIALMPSLNSYGTFAAATGSTSAIDNVAETFITAGLSKVLKINNICDKDNVFDCGFASKYTDGGGSQQDLPREIKSLNAGIITTGTSTVKNTKAAAFETANGESILTFYNPNCTSKDVFSTAYNNDGTASPTNWAGETSKQHVCVNFVYDLNGSKGPNTVGKDIGTMTVFYSSDPAVVMPMYPRAVSGSKNQTNAARACRELDNGQYRLPNIEEAIAVYYNRLIYSSQAFGSNGYVWSGTAVDANNAYVMGYSYGNKYARPKTSSNGVFCVQR
ncbi:MAG: type II secretion system GspH family protein [Fusobacterium sp.]|nr:type II secretion system GspH family protein [Fusobacterium sp.]